MNMVYDIVIILSHYIATIVCVRSGHAEGVNNQKYLRENEVYFPKEHLLSYSSIMAAAITLGRL